jgi:hypothetical protein
MTGTTNDRSASADPLRKHTDRPAGRVFNNLQPAPVCDFFEIGLKAIFSESIRPSLLSSTEHQERPAPFQYSWN